MTWDSGTGPSFCCLGQPPRARVTRCTEEGERDVTATAPAARTAGTKDEITAFGALSFRRRLFARCLREELRIVRAEVFREEQPEVLRLAHAVFAQIFQIDQILHDIEVFSGVAFPQLLRILFLLTRAERRAEGTFGA